MEDSAFGANDFMEEDTDVWYRVCWGDDFVPVLGRGYNAFDGAYEAAKHYGWLCLNNYELEERPQDCVWVERLRKEFVIHLPGRKPLIVKRPKGRYSSAYRAAFMAVRKVFLDEQKAG